MSTSPLACALTAIPLLTVPTAEIRNTNHLFAKGAIESITLPRGWLISEKSSDSVESSELDVCSPTTDPWIQMGVYYRGEPISKEASDALANLMLLKSALRGAQVLMPKEIRTLHQVLGAGTVGNNQFTNCIPAGSRSAPNFNLRIAHTRNLNGKIVLAVHGDFINPLDPDRKPVNSFEGIFFDGGMDVQSGRRKVQEVFIQGPAARMYRYRKMLVDTLDSIEWVSI